MQASLLSTCNKEKPMSQQCEYWHCTQLINIIVNKWGNPHVYLISTFGDLTVYAYQNRRIYARWISAVTTIGVIVMTGDGERRGRRSEGGHIGTSAGLVVEILHRELIGELCRFSGVEARELEDKEDKGEKESCFEGWETEEEGGGFETEEDCDFERGDGGFETEEDCDFERGGGGFETKKDCDFERDDGSFETKEDCDFERESSGFECEEDCGFEREGSEWRINRLKSGETGWESNEETFEDEGICFLKEEYSGLKEDEESVCMYGWICLSRSLDDDCCGDQKIGHRGSASLGVECLGEERYDNREEKG